MRSRRGSSLLEFAISFAVLWTIFSGVVEIGYTTFIYNKLLGQLSTAAMYASRADFPMNRPADFAARVKNIAVYGDLSPNNSSSIPNFGTAQVDVTWTSDSAGMPQTVTLAVVNFPVLAFFNQIVLQGKPSITVRYAGNYEALD